MRSEHRALYVTVIFVGIAILGCEPPQPGRTIDLQPSRPSVGGQMHHPLTAQSEQDTQIGDAKKQVMALINGQPIYMETLCDLLVRSSGIEVARQLITNELVRQGAAEMNISVSDQEVSQQGDRTLETLFPEVTDTERRDRLLKQLLVSKGMSRKLWDMTMRRNALLRKLSARHVNVTDEQIQAEFEDRYTRKVQIRHIQAASGQEAQEILRALAGGEDFAKLAERVSKNPTARDGGLLPPLGPNTSQAPPPLRKAALAMEAVGQIAGPIQVGTSFHIIKLVKIIEPQNVKFEDVKDLLSEAIRQRQLDLAGQNTLRQILDKALENQQIKFVNPILEMQTQEEASK